MLFFTVNASLTLSTSKVKKPLTRGPLTQIKARWRPMDDKGAMTPELAAKYATPVPRYTSYPTAPHFSPAVISPPAGHG